MKCWKVCLVLVLFLCWALHLSAQQEAEGRLYDLTLSFVDSLERKPVWDVSCLVYRQGEQAEPLGYRASDSLGVVRFRLGEGRYTIKASLLGRMIYQEDLALSEAYARTVLVGLNRRLDEVVIQRSRSALRSEAGKLHFDVQAGGFGRAANSYSASEVLSHIPRVEVVGDKVLIDGEPAEVHIDGVKQSNVGIYLSTLTAADLRSVEVSFGRDASTSGVAAGGVVNLRMRQSRGLVLDLGARLIAGEKGGYDGFFPTKGRESLSLLYGTDRWQVYLRGQAGQGRSTGVWERRGHEILSSGYRIESEATPNPSSSQPYMAVAGMSASLGQHKLMFELSGDWVLRSRYSEESRSVQYNPSLRYVRDVERESDQGLTSAQITHVWKSRAGSEEWRTSANHIVSTHDRGSSIGTHFTMDGRRRHEEASNWDKNKLYFLKSQFEKQLGKRLGKLSFGVEGNLVENESRYRHDTDAQEDERIDQGYRERIGAFFADYSSSWGGLSLSAGLRGEYTSLDGRGSGVDQSYMNWLPSLRLSYGMGAKKELSLSYSRSIFRPGFALMTNYRSKLDDHLYYVGNPSLRPQEMDRVTLSFSSGSISSALVYGLTKGAIEMGYYTDNNIAYLTNMNSDDQHRIEFRMGYNGKVLPFWHLSFNAGVRWMYIPNGYVQKSILYGYAQANNRFTLSPKWIVHANVGVSSPWIQQVAKINSRLASRVGLRYMPNSSWTLLCELNNPLRIEETIINGLNPYVRSYDEYALNLRSLTIGVTYRFRTKKKLKSLETTETTEHSARL